MAWHGRNGVVWFLPLCVEVSSRLSNASGVGLTIRFRDANWPTALVDDDIWTGGDDRRAADGERFEGRRPREPELRRERRVLRGILDRLAEAPFVCFSFGRDVARQQADQRTTKQLRTLATRFVALA